MGGIAANKEKNRIILRVNNSYHSTAGTSVFGVTKGGRLGAAGIGFRRNVVLGSSYEGARCR